VISIRQKFLSRRLYARILRLSALALLLGLSAGAGLGAAGSAATQQWELARLREPSGLVLHPGRNTLFVVGDEGDVAEVGLDGELLRMSVLGGDLEGVTCDPSSGLVYVLREGPDEIVEIDPDSFKVLRRFRLDRGWAGDREYIKPGGDGLEGLTFVASSEQAEGGSFFAVNQNDPPALLELLLPLRSGQGDAVARIVAAHELGPAALSAIVWLPGREIFLITSALSGRVALVGRDGSAHGTFRIPGFLPEGLALLPGGVFIIAQDTGGLIQWKPGEDPLSGLLDGKRHGD